MPSEDYMSDEYVAKLMSKDAKDTTMRYSALGIQALLPKRSICYNTKACKC